MDTLYIVIPAYNEAENIENVIRSWYTVIETHDGNGDSRLVIVNDGSRDETFEIAKTFAKERPQLVILNKPNGGHGSAVLCGYRYAVNKGADYIFQTDSDGQTNPAEFEDFWEIREENEAVIGIRPDRQDGKSRVFVEKVLCLLLRIIFGVKVPDSNAPFRLMKREFVEKFIRKLPKNYALPNVMLTTYGAYYHEKVTYRPITFKPRQAGTNSINIKKIIKIGINSTKTSKMKHLAI